MSEIIKGRNAVTEALKSNRNIEKIVIAKGSEGSIKQIEGKAGEKKIQIQYAEKVTLDKMVQDGNHQGVVATISDYEYVETSQIIARAREKGEDPFILILDGIEDPHNMGAIIRTAECAGVHGVIIPKRRSASINETVAKTSAGAVEHMLCAKVSNIVREIENLKKEGVWIAACDMGGTKLYDQDLKGGLAIVIGGEGSGISRLTREKCDFIVSIPMKGKITSLNASNAASILMYEAVRQRG